MIAPTLEVVCESCLRARHSQALRRGGRPGVGSPATRQVPLPCDSPITRGGAWRIEVNYVGGHGDVTQAVSASGEVVNLWRDARGKWYVTKKGKLCLEVRTVGLDETCCRHVFRIDDGNYYYAVKDLRPDRVAYRFTLEPA